MKTLQFCCFALRSDSLSAAEIARQLGMEADEVLVRGSRSSEYVLPRRHAWKIVRRSDESVDEQIQHLIDRLHPIRSRLISLCSEPDVAAVMQVVRYFHDPEGVRAAPAGMSWEQAQRWPRPLGWHLSMPVVEFLSATRAELDVDEYDLSDDDDDNSPA